MEPFTPNDPLWKLMGNARPVVPRPNFTQNVVRAARQEAQTLSRWAQVKEWLTAWQRPLVSGVAATALALAMGVLLLEKGGTVSTAPALAILPDAEMAAIANEDVSAPLDSLDHMDALLAMQDTSKLTDTELQFLLY
jgi:hypothetical protein